MLIGTQAFVRSSTVCYMVYVPWYKIHVHGNVFPELSKMNQRINIMVSPLAKESTPPRKHFQQLRTFWEKKRSGTPNEPTFVSAGEKKDRGTMRDVILRVKSVARNTGKKKSPRQFRPLSYHRSLKLCPYITPIKLQDQKLIVSFRG